MNDYSIPPLVSSLVFLFFGFFCLFKGKSLKQKIPIFLFCLETFCWQFAWAILFNLKNLSDADLIVRLGYSSIIFLPVTFFHFISTFIYEKVPTKLLTAFYSIGVVFLTLLWSSNYFISGYYTYYWGPYPKASFLHPFYLVFLTYLVVKILSDLWKKYKQSYHQRQLKLVFWALLIYTLASVDFLVNYGVEFYPFGVGFILISLVLLSYAVMAFNALEINVSVKAGLVQALLLFAWLVPLGIFFFKLEPYLTGPFVKTFLFGVFILIAGSFIGRLKVRANFTIDQILFKQRHDYHAAIHKLNQELVKKLNINELLEWIVATLSQALDMHRVLILLKNSNDTYKIASGVGLSITEREETYPLSRELQTNLSKQVYLQHRLHQDIPNDGNQIKQLFERLDAAIFVPIIHDGELTGILAMGEPGTDYRFDHTDAMVFSQLSTQLSIAIENAKAYQLIAELNAGLERKVRERTEELQKTLEELKAAQTQIIRAGKLAGIGSLAAGIAHEINNALNGTLNCAYALDRNLQAVFKKELPFDAIADDLAESLQVIRNGMNRTRNIVEHLMRFSRKNAEGFKMDNIHEGITSTLVLLQNEIRLRNIKLDCQFGQTAEIYCNLSELNQVFFNIIKNALDAVQHNGKISIKTWSSDGACFISIEDTGPGIDPKHIDQIFDPFFTTKSVGKGTGLGLSTSYNIVRDHGGQIEVKSEPGHGSTFIIRIPLKNYLGKAV